MQFAVAIKNPKTRFYYLITSIIVFIHVIVFVFLLFSDKYSHDSFGCLFLLVLYLVMRLYISRKNKIRFYIDQIAYLILAASWLAMRNYELMAICIALGVLYHFSLQKIRFVFTESSFRKTNFPSVEYAWKDVENVILRDDILTIDFKNNKLIQCEIDEDTSINEREFNHFAIEQLKKYSPAEKNLHLN